MPFIKAKSSQASGWGWMLSMLAFPLLFHHLQDWQDQGHPMGHHNTPASKSSIGPTPTWWPHS